MEITVRVCNICERVDQPTTRVYLRVEKGPERSLDLCGEHLAPIVALLPGASAEGRSGPARPTMTKPVKRAAKKTANRTGRKRGVHPVTLDEIEAMKARGEA